MTKETVVQNHHICYVPEIKVKVYKGEHWVLTLLHRRKKRPSRGFIKSLKQWIALHEWEAVNLE